MLAGIGEKVATITQSSMAGKLDLKQRLTESRHAGRQAKSAD